MMWKVIYTDDALVDIQNIYDYIANTLHEPNIAEKQSERILDAADSLENMPFRHRLYNDEPWRSKGLRISPVDNYLILYLPNESQKSVAVIRIIYGGRDISRQLIPIENE